MPTILNTKSIAIECKTTEECSESGKGLNFSKNVGEWTGQPTTLSEYTVKGSKILACFSNNIGIYLVKI